MFDFLFGQQSEPLVRDASAQAEADARASRLALYHYDSCPYCQYVRRVIKSLAVNIELRNIHTDRSHHADLVAGGGRQTVPCLRIEHDNGEVDWLYESQAIATYLTQQFSQASGA